MVSLVAEEIATTPHAGKIILGAQEAASRHNLMLAIINSEPEPRCGYRLDRFKPSSTGKPTE